MSGATKIAAVKVIQNFPDAGALLARKTSPVPNAWVTGSPCTQTDATGIKELTITPAVSTAGCLGVLVCFDAPSDAVASAWFADTTQDSTTLQWAFVPVMTTRTWMFSTAITRWDYQAVTQAAIVYQEIAR